MLEHLGYRLTLGRLESKVKDRKRPRGTLQNRTVFEKKNSVVAHQLIVYIAECVVMSHLPNQVNIKHKLIIKTLHVIQFLLSGYSLGN